MLRTLSTIVLTTLMSSALFAQTSAYSTDPVADLTRNIISQYVPQAYLPRATVNYGVASPAIGYGLYSDYRLPSFQPLTQLDLGFGTPGIGYQPFYGDLNELAPRFYLPRPQLFTPLPNVFSPKLPLNPATVTTGQSLPRPLSMSMASTNGVYAIQAVVPTENGQEKVNLNGTREEVRTQLESLSPQTRSMMRRSLGM